MLCATGSYNNRAAVRKLLHDERCARPCVCRTAKQYSVLSVCATTVDTMTMAQGLRVLLVEDSKVLTERLTEAIRQIPDVELIGTADTEAAALAAVKRDSVDVIILDFALEAGHGLRRHARARHYAAETAHHRAHELRSSRIQECGHRARRHAFPRQGSRLRAAPGSAARDLRNARLQALKNPEARLVGTRRRASGRLGNSRVMSTGRAQFLHVHAVQAVLKCLDLQLFRRSSLGTSLAWSSSISEER